MNMLNVATALNAGSRPAESGKKGKDSGEVTDDFKKFLQGKSEEAENTAPDSKVSNKDLDDKKEEVCDTDDEEVKDVGQNIQTNGLFAAYQLDQGMRPDMLQVEAAPEMAEAVQETESPIGIVEAQQPVSEQQHMALAELPQAEQEEVAHQKVEP